MNKKIHLPTKVLLAGTVGLLSACASETKQELTNFIIIHLDDMGYGDLSVTGAMGYSTPHIDRLCAEGTRFTNFYSSQAVSSASRAGLLTGCYPNRVGFFGALRPGSKTGLHPDEKTIADVLKTKGYATAAIGKWHIGDHPEFMPLQFGFDSFFGLPYSNDMWPYHPTMKFPPLPLYENEKIINADVSASDQEQLTTQYTEKAVEFIHENAGKPFFIYLAHSMPHVPLFVSEKFKGKSEQGLYGDVMMEIDWSVGEIIKALEATGLSHNTMVVFTSDNGPWLNYGNHAGSTGGLREGKGSSFEGGQRVPCIFWWPGTIAAGEVNNSLMSAIDLLPTLADISGAQLPEKKIDGLSFRKVLERNNQAEGPRKNFLYYYRRNSLEAVRNEQFKLVFAHKGRSYENQLPGNDGMPGKVEEYAPFEQALYDLRRDPGERYDVYDLYPEVVAELQKIADQAREDLGDDLTGHEGKNRRPCGKVE